MVFDWRAFAEFSTPSIDTFAFEAVDFIDTDTEVLAWFVLTVINV